jgi:hypothetical protein
VELGQIALVAEARVEYDVVAAQGRLERIGGGRVERAAVFRPGRLTHAAYGGRLLVAEQARGLADGIELGGAPFQLGLEPLDLLTPLVDQRIVPLGRRPPGFNGCRVGHGQCSKLLRAPIPGRERHQSRRQQRAALGSGLGRAAQADRVVTLAQCRQG